MPGSGLMLSYLSEFLTFEAVNNISPVQTRISGGCLRATPDNHVSAPDVQNVITLKTHAMLEMHHVVSRGWSLQESPIYIYLTRILILTRAKKEAVLLVR